MIKVLFCWTLEIWLTSCLLWANNSSFDKGIYCYDCQTKALWSDSYSQMLIIGGGNWNRISKPDIITYTNKHCVGILMFNFWGSQACAYGRDSAMQGFLLLFLTCLRNSITNWKIVQLCLTILEEFTLWKVTNASKLFAQSTEVREINSEY